MSFVYLGFLLLGLFFLLIFFKRKIDSANRTIEIGGTHSSYFRKFPHVRQAEHEKGIYQITGALSIFCYLAVTLNFHFGIVESWVVLAAIGICVSISAFLINTTPTSFEDEEATDKTKLQNLLRVEEAKKISLIILVVTIVISGNWAYQIHKNESENRQSATQEVSRLTQTGWCSNFQDINVYDGGSDVVKSGGWPCIYIGSVSGISFSKEKKVNKMCIQVGLNRENGPPGQESFELSYRDVQVCALDDWNEGWSESTFSGKIYEVAKLDLNALQVSLCRAYGYSMGQENYSTYC